MATNDVSQKNVEADLTEDVQTSHDSNVLPLPQELAHLDLPALRQLEQSAVRQLDTFLLPAVILLFLLNILDRNNIANAKIVGLAEDLHMTNNEYNTCLMIFYVGCESSVANRGALLTSNQM